MDLRNGRTWKGLKSSVSRKKRALSTALFSLLAFTTILLTSNIAFTETILSEGGLFYLPTAVAIRSSGLVTSSGVLGWILTAVFSALVGVTVTNTLVKFSMNRLDKSIAGSIPGFLAGGCASCGVGILHIFGLGWVFASMPFGGNLLRIAGIGLLIGLIRYNGDPETCRV